MITYHIILVAIMCLLGSLGAVSFKASGKKPLLTNIIFYIGGLLYFASLLINIYLLKYYDYSVILPLSSISFIFTLLLAKLFFCEIINAQKVLGILMIIVGVTFVAIA